MCLFSFPQLLCSIIFTHPALSKTWSWNPRNPTSTTSLTKHWIPAFLWCVLPVPEAMALLHLLNSWWLPGFISLKHLQIHSSLSHFGQHSQGSDVAQMKSCPTDLCVFWPKMELHISMAGMCWMLNFVIKLHFSNQTQPHAIVLKATLLLRVFFNQESTFKFFFTAGITAFKITSSSSCHCVSFRRNKGSHYNLSH